MPAPRRGQPRDPEDAARAFRKAAQRTWTARALMALALVIVIQHLLAHGGWKPIPISMGNQDLLIGYPSGALIGLVGLLIWGNTPSR